MRRRAIGIAFLTSAVLLCILYLEPVGFMPGMTKLASDSGIDWYLPLDSLKMSEYADEGIFLDALVVTHHRGSGDDSYIEKNGWHIDEEGNRYKVSFTSSYDCEGTELGT